MTLTRRDLLKGGAATLIAAAGASSGPVAFAAIEHKQVRQRKTLIALADAPVPIPALGRKVLYRDLFPGTVLNPAWTKDTGTNPGNGNIQQYTPDCVTVDDGICNLTARHSTPADDFPPGFPWASGRITLNQEFLYGRFVADLALPTYPGMFPAETFFAPSMWPPELDGVEWWGSTPGTIHQTAHWKDPAGTFQLGHGQTVLDIRTRVHRYEMWWTPQFVTWMVNGAPTFSITDPLQVPSTPMQLSFNLGVSGPLAWGGATTAATPATDTMRLYQFLATGYEI